MTGESLPLSADEVAALPEGMHIVVIWSGGNGPHHYIVAIAPDGRRYAGVERDRQSPYYFAWASERELRFVGRERFHTRVWLTDHFGSNQQEDQTA